MIGYKSGKLEVIEFVELRKHHAYWKCKCACGNTVIVEGNNLRRKKQTACGCNRELNLTKKKFGKLTVIKKTKEKKSNGVNIWLCKCSCGNFAKISSSNLVRNATKSCGCKRPARQRDWCSL